MGMPVESAQVIAALRNCHLFKGLNEEQLAFLAAQWQAFYFEEGQVLYEEGQDAQGFYFIYSGRVRLSTRFNDKEEVTFLEEGDYFGEEALSPTPLARRATASAASPLIVLYLGHSAWLALERDLPMLRTGFRLIRDSYLLAARKHFAWRGPREAVRYITRRHPLFLILRIILPLIATFALGGLFTLLAVVVWHGAPFSLILLGLILLAGLGWLLWSAIDWTNDYFIITNRRVIALERVILFYESRQEVPLEAILADEVQTDQLGRLIDYGHLIVRTYTGQLILDRLAHPQHVLALLDEQRERARHGRRQAQRAAIEATIRSRIGLPTPAPAGQASEGVEFSSPQPGSRLGELVSRLFMLRQEQGDTIIYRTHWFILLSKTFWPFWAIVVSLVLGALILLQRLPLPPLFGVVLLVVVLPLACLWWLYQYVDWRNDRYIITPEMVIDVYKKPLGVEDKRSAPLRNIQSIEYKRKTIIGLLLNFGTVYIRIGDTQFTFDDVYNPSEVQRELFQRLVALKQRDEQRAEQTQREQLAEWIELYHRVVQNGTSSPGEQTPPPAPNQE